MLETIPKGERNGSYRSIEKIEMQTEGGCPRQYRREKGKGDLCK